MKRLLNYILILNLLTVSKFAFAARADIMAGAYSFSAKSSSSSGSKSGVAIYRLNYLIPVLANLDVALGYSIIATQVVTGDFAYGLDLSLNYYPFTVIDQEHVQVADKVLITEEVFRPYFGIGFHQRQFQSISNSFGGFGFSAGFERPYNQKFSLKFESRYILFSGASSSSASELSLSSGLIFKF